MKKILIFSCVLIVFSLLASAQESCKTPDNAFGVCISLRDCSPLLKLVLDYEKTHTAQKAYLQQSQCSPTDWTEYIPKVCCPSKYPETNLRPSLIRDPSKNRTTNSQTDLSTNLTTNLTTNDSQNPQIDLATKSPPKQQTNSSTHSIDSSRNPPLGITTYRPTYQETNTPKNPPMELTTHLSENASQIPQIDLEINIPTDREINASEHSSTNLQVDLSTNLPLDVTTYKPANSSKKPDLGPHLNESDLPAPGECGTQSSNRILQGEITQIHEYPWIALIQYAKDEGQKRFSCGATLINKDYVLTAAHCLKSRNLDLTGWIPQSIRLGEHNLQSKLDCEDDICADPVLDIPISEIIMHEEYDSESNGRYYDIALIRLSRSINYTEFIKPICLPFAPHVKNITFEDGALISTEFGKAKNGAPGKLKLRRHFTQTQWDKCNEQYIQETNVSLTTKQFCASIQPQYDSCGSSSGVGMMYEDVKKSIRPFYLVAISSFGPYYCSTGFPGVFTRVDQYLDWITKHMKK